MKKIIITFNQKTNAYKVFDVMKEEYTLFLYEYKEKYYVTTEKAENKDFVLLEQA